MSQLKKNTTRLLILVSIFLGGCVLLALFYNDDQQPKTTQSTPSAAVTQDTQNQRPVENNLSELSQTCEAEITALDTFSGINYETFLQELEEINRIKKFYIQSIHKDSALDSRLELLLNKILRIQTREFPRMRKAYIELAAKTVWEENMDVKSGGNNPKIIQFISAGFADRKGIKMFHEQVRDMIFNLRFTHVYYRWYKHDDDPQIFITYAPKDNEF